MRHKIIKRAGAFLLASVMALGAAAPGLSEGDEPDTPAAAEEMTEDAPADTGDGGAEAEDIDPEAGKADAGEGADAEAKDGGDGEETQEPDTYIICLPEGGGAGYSYDGAHRSEEHSDAALTVLLYEAGEEVSIAVTSELSFALYGTDGSLFLDPEGGTLDFAMPAKDLQLIFDGPREEAQAQPEDQTGPVKEGDEQTGDLSADGGETQAGDEAREAAGGEEAAGPAEGQGEAAPGTEAAASLKWEASNVSIEVRPADGGSFPEGAKLNVDTPDTAMGDASGAEAYGKAVADALGSRIPEAQPWALFPFEVTLAGGEDPSACEAEYTIRFSDKEVVEAFQSGLRPAVATYSIAHDTLAVSGMEMAEDVDASLSDDGRVAVKFLSGTGTFTAAFLQDDGGVLPAGDGAEEDTGLAEAGGGAAAGTGADAGQEGQDTEDAPIRLTREVAIAGGSLRLRYTASAADGRQKDRIAASGLTAVFPAGMEPDSAASDPSGQYGYTIVRKGDDSWEAAAGGLLAGAQDPEGYSSAAIWDPEGGNEMPDPFEYYVSVPEGTTPENLGDLSPVILICAGEVVPASYDGDWGGTELLPPGPAGDDPENEGPEMDPGPGGSNTLFVSKLVVSDVFDGTSPFDSDDSAGNDSGNQNAIVRSFDTVDYTLSYTLEDQDPTAVRKEGTMHVEFTIEEPPSVARFNDETLLWCSDKAVSYYDADGSPCTGADDPKVAKQVLTGTLKIVSDKTIIGAGTLKAGLRIYAAPNKKVISPKFKVWMEGNDIADPTHGAKEVSCADGHAVTVSAAPRYNIELKRNDSLSYYGYFNDADGTVSTSDNGGKLGRLFGYSLVLQLYNVNADHGLKGIELPTGDITFDVSLQEKVNGSDASGQADFTPSLWDYKEHMYSSDPGKLKRQMEMGGNINTAYNRYSPLNSGNNHYSCYDGGSIEIAASGTLMHVTVKDYGFDLKDFQFPTQNILSEDLGYGANVGCFSVGYIETLCRFPQDVGSNQELVFYIHVDNLSARSVSGQETTTDQNANDNASSEAVRLMPVGSITKFTEFRTGDCGHFLNHAGWGSGDSYGYPGLEIALRSYMSTERNDNTVTSVNILQKFDDEAFMVPAGTKTFKKQETKIASAKTGDVTTLFAAKPDKSGWESDDEMLYAREEALVYFDDIDSLTAAGYTCVGVLYEVRHSELPASNPAIGFYLPLVIREGAKAGSVYQAVADLRAWREDPEVFSWRSVKRAEGYGLGDSGWQEGTYQEGYAAPTWAVYLGYNKTEYSNGVISGGHTNGEQGGDSVLIVGSKTRVSIKVADKQQAADGSYETKNVYDLDQGERTVQYRVQPYTDIVSENASLQGSKQTTDVTVTVKLPPGLAYIPDSSSLEPSSVTPGDDGSTTIVWLLEDCEVGADLDGITFKCTIGAAGTPNDLLDGTTLSAEATICSDSDHRIQNSYNNNWSEASIRVSRMAFVSISKDTDQDLIEAGAPISYTMYVLNSSNVVGKQCRLLDILPFNGDGRESSFHGGYTLDRIEVTFSSENPDRGLKVFTTSGTDIQGGTLGEKVTEGGTGAGGTWKDLGAPTKEGEKLIWEGLDTPATAALFELGDIGIMESAFIRFVLKTSGNSPADKYVNDFMEGMAGQAKVVTSNIVQTQVVERDLSGVAWLDADKDGVRAPSETLLEGIAVSLYRTEPSAHDTKKGAVATAGGAALYRAYDVFGNAVGGTTTGEDGSYQFSALEAGTYYVVFSGTGQYRLTKKDVGKDDTADSDAVGVVESGRLASAYIGDIAFPEAEDMPDFHVSVEHEDMGVYLIPQFVLPDTGGAGSAAALAYSLLACLAGLALAMAGAKRKIA